MALKTIKYIVAYTKRNEPNGLIEAIGIDKESAKIDARRKLRIKYGDNACFCAITRVTVRRMQS